MNPHIDLTWFRNILRIHVTTKEVAFIRSRDRKEFVQICPSADAHRADAALVSVTPVASLGLERNSSIKFPLELKLSILDDDRYHFPCAP